MRRYRILSRMAAALPFFILSLATKGESSELHQEDGILSNHSAEYVRTLNRNTSTDPDAAFYNPAGLAFMTLNGLYISFSSQTYYVKRTHSMDFYKLQKLESEPEPVTPPHNQEWFRDCLTDEYPAELTAPVLPGIDIVWKQDNRAFYLDIAVMQAATDMTYPEGLAVMDWGNLLSEETGLASGTHLVEYIRNAEAVRNEMYIGVTLGGAYRLKEWISAGGGLRIIHAQGNMKINMNNIHFIENDGTDPTPAGDTPRYLPDSEDSWDIDTDTTGIGYGIILSTHFRPEGITPILRGLEATFRFEYYPTMELEKKTNRFLVPTLIEKSGNLNIFKDGSPGDEMEYSQGNGSKTLKVTYPSTLNFGLSYLLFDRFRLLSSAQISLRQMRDLDGREKDYTIGYQAGGGVEFILNPKITLSTGYLYNDFGIKPNCRTEADPLLNSHQIGAGACFHVDEFLDVNIGGFYQIFIPATTYTVEYVNVSEPTQSYLKKDFDEKRYSVAIGVTYRLFGEDDRIERSRKNKDKSEDKDEGNNKSSGKTNRNKIRERL